jgi:hypothetical protein
LTRQLREERVRGLIDLRVAAGLIKENERSDSEAKLPRLPDDAIEIMRRDLVKILARINPADTAAALTSAGSAAYVA